MSDVYKSANPPVSPSRRRRKYDEHCPSPNGRASCQRCGSKIAKDSIRVAIQAQYESTAPGRYPVWRKKHYHEACVTPETIQQLLLGSEGKKRKNSGSSSSAAFNGNKTAVTSGKRAKLDIANEQVQQQPRGKQLNPKIRKRLERELRSLRSTFARRLGYDEECKIFPNDALRDILLKLPSNEAELMKCRNIKEKRCRYYGSSILQVVRSCLWTKHEVIVLDGTMGEAAASSTSGTRRGGTTAADAVLDSEEDSDDDIVVGATVSVEDIVSNRLREAEERGEVFEVE